MGDRANIVTQTQGPDRKPERVYLYGHWSGSQMHTILQNALRKNQRLTDCSYLTRIIFDVLTEGHHGEETGFGISASITDNEYPLLVVDTEDQKVIIEDADHGTILATMSFKDFCALNLPDSYGNWLGQLGVKDYAA